MDCPICGKTVEKGGMITIEVMDNGSLYYEHFNQKFDEIPWCMEASPLTQLFLLNEAIK